MAEFDSHSADLSAFARRNSAVEQCTEQLRDMGSTHRQGRTIGPVDQI